MNTVAYRAFKSLKPFKFTSYFLVFVYKIFCTRSSIKIVKGTQNFADKQLSLGLLATSIFRAIQQCNLLTDHRDYLATDNDPSYEMCYQLVVLLSHHSFQWDLNESILRGRLHPPLTSNLCLLFRYLSVSNYLQFSAQL